MKTQLFSLVSAARELEPSGAVVLFVAGWLAGLAGSISALLIAAALFAGLYGARIVAAAKVLPTVDVQPIALAEPSAAPSSSPIAEALANGLTIKKIEFSQAAAGKARKTA